MARDEIVATVERLTELSVGAIVDTGQHRREKTYWPDEWDMVMDAEEVLEEGAGSVTVIYDPEGQA